MSAEKICIIGLVVIALACVYLSKDSVLPIATGLLGWLAKESFTEKKE